MSIDVSLREMRRYAFYQKCDKFRLVALIFVRNAKNDNRPHTKGPPKALPQPIPMMLLHHEYDVGVLDGGCIQDARRSEVEPG
jgi:hypothetical protein